MIKSKKAFEMQFNWIFVLVAGTAILIFFAAVILKQKSVSEVSARGTVLKSIEAIVSSAGASRGTTNIITMPDSEIEISCNRISLGTTSKQYQNLLLFAPSLIKGNSIITQTLDFNVPYRAANLLFITSPQVRYIIVGNDGLAREINMTIPADVNKEFYGSLPNIANLNNYKVRIIIFGPMVQFPQSLEKMPDIDVTALRVEGNDEQGMIEFYQKKGASWMQRGTSYYLTKASLAAAVYADTPEAYECGMGHALKRLSLVTKIYAERTSKIMMPGTSGREVQCNNIYNTALSNFRDIDTTSSNIVSQGLSAQETSLLNSASASLKSLNGEAQLYSCTMIY